LHRFSEALSREAAAAAQSREAAAISTQLVADHATALAIEQQRFAALETRHAGAAVELGARAAEIASLKAQVPFTFAPCTLVRSEMRVDKMHRLICKNDQYDFIRFYLKPINTNRVHCICDFSTLQTIYWIAQNTHYSPLPIV
jgi:hypothetical protein